MTLAGDESNPSWLVAGREPWRGKWHPYQRTLTRAAAVEYSEELVEAGWRDVVVVDLRFLRDTLPRRKGEAA